MAHHASVGAYHAHGVLLCAPCRHRVRCCAGSVPSAVCSARVARFLSADRAGLLPDAGDLSADVVFSSDIVQIRGREQLASAFEAWNNAWQNDRGLHESNWTITRSTSLAQNVETVTWRVRWLPLGLLPFVRLGRGLQLQVSFYDLLDRYDRVSVFSWSKLFAALATAIRTGVLRLPEAVVEGTTEFTFDSNGFICRIDERCTLVPQFKALRVRNRRVARDVADWFSEWRPMSRDAPEEWDAAIRRELQLLSVPGMGQFDIDGLSPETQAQRIDDVGTLLGFATIAVLLFGGAAAKLRADEIGRSRKEREWMQAGNDDEEVGQRMRSRRQALFGHK